MRLYYYPGCSLATTAKECNRSLMEVTKFLDLELIDIPDWNCCGSTSAHSIERRIALDLSLRNLSLLPPDEILMVMCPNCLHNFHQSQQMVKVDPHRRFVLENRWQRPIDPNAPVMHFLEILAEMDPKFLQSRAKRELKGLKVAPYYGCMLSRPPLVSFYHCYRGLIERLMESFGAQTVLWPNLTKCCGTFLSAAKPPATIEAVNQIIGTAIESGAECLVTACAMCQLNLEIRCTLKEKIPTFHFTELLAIVLGAQNWQSWFSYHLVDPVSILENRHII